MIFPAEENCNSSDIIDFCSPRFARLSRLCGWIVRHKKSVVSERRTTCPKQAYRLVAGYLCPLRCSGKFSAASHRRVRSIRVDSDEVRTMTTRPTKRVGRHVRESRKPSRKRHNVCGRYVCMRYIYLCGTP